MKTPGRLIRSIAGALLAGMFAASALHAAYGAEDDLVKRVFPGGVSAVELAVKSEAMGRAMPALVLLPASYAQQTSARYPVLYQASRDRPSVTPSSKPRQNRGRRRRTITSTVLMEWGFSAGSNIQT